ncbi:extracellular solute-binding protein [Rhodobacteraceae bacterium CCMM004]|nr:extracellular solute-binding protein [Rhodobacteraceae bacterium CCMM004]
MSWDQIVEQAKAEGELTWYVWYLQDDLRRAVQAFEDEYGIEVTIPEGGDAGGNANKLLAERERETGDIDVFAWGYNDFETVDLDALFMPLTHLPEDDGRVSELTGIDGGDHVLAYWGNQTGVAYDPAHVSADDLPQTPEEFAAFWAENPGKFGFNYEKGGSGPSYYLNMLRVLSDGVDFFDGESNDEKLAGLQPGIDFFNAHADNYVVTASNADSILRVSDGELWMVPAWEDHLAGLQNRGEVRSDIAFYIPEMGMNGGGNGVAIPLNAPNPAAASVFIHWLTSPETQTMFNRTFGTAPMNAASDDSFALVPNAQREFRTPWAAQPFRGEVEQRFVDDVILER